MQITINHAPQARGLRGLDSLVKEADAPENTPHCLPTPRRHGIGGRRTNHIYSGTTQISPTTRSDAPPTHDTGCKFPAAAVANTRGARSYVRAHSYGQILKPCIFSLLPFPTAERAKHGADHSHNARNATSFTPGVQYQAPSHARNTAIQCHTIDRYKDPRAGSSDATSVLTQHESCRKRGRRARGRR